jgi:phosphomannomutase
MKNEPAPPSCFKSYDIRGRVPDQLDAALAHRIGRGFAHLFTPRAVVIGHDCRLTSPELAEAVATGLVEGGVEVLHLGLVGTEEVYHAAFSMADSGVDGGIMITASHNPADENGCKLVTRGAVPVTAQSGLARLGELVCGAELPLLEPAGRRRVVQTREAYIDHLLSYVNPASLRPLTIVANSGNGCAGAIVDLLAEKLPFTVIRMHHQPDGSFPHGVPNPLLAANRAETSAMVRKSGADMGIAWDGDFDRCFFWDEQGEFIESYYIVGLLAETLLADHPGQTILHDARLVWNTQDCVARAGGVARETKAGHALIKEHMRRENSLYGGEMSGHHYFRSFGYCDSGMIPWLLVSSLLSAADTNLSELINHHRRAYPASGEINMAVADPGTVLAMLAEHYRYGTMSRVDGLSVAYPSFRFNVRASTTEPLLRLNIETRGDVALLQEKTAELTALIKAV